MVLPHDSLNEGLCQVLTWLQMASYVSCDIMLDLTSILINSFISIPRNEFKQGKASCAMRNFLASYRHSGLSEVNHRPIVM